MVSKGKIYFNQKNLLEHYLESITDGIAITDINGVNIDVNFSLVKMLGFEKKKDIIGKPFFAQLPKNDLKRVKKRFERYISKKETTLRNYEITLKKKNGGEIPVLLNVNSIYEKGILIGNISVLRDISDLKKLENDKKELKEKIKRLTKNVGLTKYEKLVLYGLVRYPLLNDREMSKRLNLKRSTITAIRNKLFKRGFCKTYVAPNLYTMNCASMCILTGKIPEDKEDEGKKIINEVISLPEVVRSIQTEKNFLIIASSENFGDIKEIIDIVSSLYSKKNKNMLKIFHFPFKKSIMTWNYSNLVKILFGLSGEVDESKEDKIPLKKDLKSREKLVLYALSKYPLSTDTEIAKKLKLSRPTVTKIKKNMIKENILRIINVPNYKKLNFELLCYSYAKRDFDVTKEFHVPNCIFCVNQGEESSKLLVFKNFLEYKNERARFKEFLKKYGVTNEDSGDYLYFLSDVIREKLDFSGLIKKGFNLEVNI
ncbi:MAG: PAS domain S-box protein [Nanoarchaeota archaeon]|nr:PAS domain S-box protein [Nanoarchaeota archaeon]